MTFTTAETERQLSLQRQQTGNWSLSWSQCRILLIGRSEKPKQIIADNRPLDFRQTEDKIWEATAPADFEKLIFSW